MNTYLQNERIRVGIKPMGAELFSIQDRKSGKEYMWKADPAFWGKTSPVLFPIVGTLRENKYKFNGKEYALPRHGFAREMPFELRSNTDTIATFTLESSDKTLAKFPFPFRLDIGYSVEGAMLIVDYHVFNAGDTDMYFSLGAHPAFAVPLADGLHYSDYYLQFNQRETAPRWRIDAAGLIEPVANPCLDNSDRLNLLKELFYKDAIVLKDLSSTLVTLRHKTDPHGFEFRFHDFPYLGIWAAKDADFLCIEPWCGIADNQGHNYDITTKEGIEKLAPKATWTRRWSITIF
ncbi:aldose 1-epimerase family protein [Chryseolinea sp. T2]|uniref:aldose 1-epimerase family protein n=1 Tax=Chryseolinea sp. T2 TaxID=3129255 RepID=UPI003077F40C